MSSAVDELDLFLTQRPGRQLSLISLGVAAKGSSMLPLQLCDRRLQVATGSDLMEARLSISYGYLTV